MKETAGRKHRGGTACNLNEKQNVNRGHGRSVKEDTTGDAVKVGWAPSHRTQSPG